MVTIDLSLPNKVTFPMDTQQIVSLLQEQPHRHRRYP